MNDCSELRHHLIDHALGEPAPATLALHLQHCAACATEIDQLRAIARTIDAGVHELISVSPTSPVPARVLAEIAKTAPARVWRPWPAFAALGALAAIVAFVVVAPLTKRAVPQTVAATQLTQWRSPTAMLLTSPSDSLLDGRMHDLFGPAPRLRFQTPSVRKAHHA